MIKLYGYTRILGFPCFCYGKKAYFFTIRWSKKHKWFRVHRGHTCADDIIFQTRYNAVNDVKSWKFIGFMKLNKTYINLEQNF